MSFSTTTNRIQYTGNGVTTVFAIGSPPFLFYDDTHIVVTPTTISTGVDGANWVQGADYTITKSGDSSNGFMGSIVTSVAPSSDTRLTIQRIVPYTQTIDFRDGSDSPASTFERASDLPMMAATQLADAATRSLLYAATATTVPPSLPVLQASKFLSVDAGGTVLQWTDVATAGAIALPVPITQGGTGAITASAARTNLGVISLTDGDKGDITVSSSGTVWSIDASTITTTKLVNSNVTLAKIANAAASNKLLGSGASGSGAPYAELTLGTNLSMSGTTLNAAGGSQWVLLDTQSASGASVNFNSKISSSYDVYEFVFKDMVYSAGAAIWLRGSINNGSSIVTTAGNYFWKVMDRALNSATDTETVGGGSETKIVLTAAASAPPQGTVRIVNPLSASIGLSLVTCDFATSGPSVVEAWGFFNFAAINAVQFLLSTGTFTSGTIYMYGLKNT